MNDWNGHVGVGMKYTRDRLKLVYFKISKCHD